jgi:hypothetical protein
MVLIGGAAYLAGGLWLMGEVLRGDLAVAGERSRAASGSNTAHSALLLPSAAPAGGPINQFHDDLEKCERES